LIYKTGYTGRTSIETKREREKFEIMGVQEKKAVSLAE
jgi:hypothetical protein